MIRGSPVKHDQNCLLKFPKAFRQKYFKLVLQNRFYYAKKKKKKKNKAKKTNYQLFQVLVHTRIQDLDDLYANSIKCGYTFCQILIMGFELVLSKKQYLL